MEQYDTTPIQPNNGCETIGELECELERLVGDLWGHMKSVQRNQDYFETEHRRLREAALAYKEERARYLQYFDTLEGKVYELIKRVAELERQKTANENNQDDPEWY